MKTPLVQPAAPTPTASVSEFIVTFAIVLAAIFGMLLFDTALARVDSRERKAYATREFATAERLMGEKKTSEAIDHLRSATSLDADNSSYATALAEAILEDGRPDDANLILGPVLERKPKDGAANLVMARVLARENRIEDAKAYYHTAIDGIWPAGAAARRLAARFELIDLLARTNEKPELLAELLPIQEDSSLDGDHRKLIAHLFVQAGSPARAVAIFREFLRKNPGDVDAYVGLADAALSLGDLSTGRNDLIAAQKLLPDTTAMKARIGVVDSAVALDPTQTGLALAEQARRSRVLLQLTVDAVQKCLGKQAPDVAPALDSIRPMLLSHAPAEGQAQSIQQTISVAEQLWGLRRARCAPAADDTPLALVHNRIGH
ncbi:MAG TPA: tetratricopeptide repeat protein [Gemmatimonadaceae bacterium]|nr:tetratricopeptide repeat protein [Gemmatimonadaceae bacterium]